MHEAAVSTLRELRSHHVRRSGLSRAHSCPLNTDETIGCSLGADVFTEAGVLHEIAAARGLLAGQVGLILIR